MNRLRTILLGAGATTAALLTATAAFAQDTGQPASGDSANAADEIIVTARFREERLQDVPIAVTAFSEENIIDAKIDQVGDFIQLTPNVTIAQSESSGLSAISIRGITQVRNSEAPVAVVVDGVLQVNSRQFTQELFDVQSIQVLRGPQGALYGRNATGGAIIINTRQPTNDLEGHVRAGYATGDEYLLEGSVSGPLVADKLLFRVGARYVDREGYFTNINLDRKQDPFEDISVRGLLKWNPSDRLTVDLRGALSRTDGGSLNFRFQQANLGPDDVSLDPAAPFDFTRPGDANLVDRQFYSTNVGVDDRDIDEASLKADLDLDFATLTSISSWNRLSEFTGGDQFPYTATLGFFGTDGTQTQFTDVEAWSQEVRLTSSSDGPLRWMVGAYYLDTDRFISTTTGTDTGQGILRVTSQPFFGDARNPTLTYLADDNDNENYAGFGNVAYDIVEGLEASVALRYDKEIRHQSVSPLNTAGAPGAENRASFDKWQPKVTLTYEPSDQLTAYASWGEGFRSGQFNQNGVAAAALAAGVAGVADRVPQENTETAEVGVKSELADRRLRLSGALFQTKVENQQYFVFIGAVGAQVLVPIDRVDLWGGEVEAVARVGEGLDAYASFGFTNSEVERYTVNPAAEGNDAPYVPKTTINAGVQYRTALTDAFGLFARADYRRLGRQFWDPENTTPRSNVSLADFRLGIEDPDGRWSLIGSVENAFDKKYNSEFVIPGFAHPAAPRVWRIDARFNF